jgi:tripartite-type tricarboxylate transporter receptor subunit TctC
VPYDPVKDFAPITMPVSSPLVVVVHPEVPVKSVRDLIDLAKSKPGALNYGSPGSGAPTQISVELFKSMAGVNIVSVPYKGAGPALIALIAAEVQLMFATAGGVATHTKSGRLRPVAVTSAQPSALIPGLPAVAASLPGYESVASYGIFAPAKTPAAIISRLNRELLRALSSADVKQKFWSEGIETVGNSPAEFAAVIKSERDRLGKVIRDAGIRAN